eukprot:3111093-Prymnesium_polylepis.2
MSKGFMSDLASFSGLPESYAVMGIHRDVSFGCSEKLKSAFAMTHSIYSFFLLNIKVTVEAHVLYPAKSFWEE